MYISYCFEFNRNPFMARPGPEPEPHLTSGELSQLCMTGCIISIGLVRLHKIIQASDIPVISPENKKSALELATQIKERYDPGFDKFYEVSRKNGQRPRNQGFHYYDDDDDEEEQRGTVDTGPSGQNVTVAVAATSSSGFAAASSSSSVAAAPVSCSVIAAADPCHAIAPAVSCSVVPAADPGNVAAPSTSAKMAPLSAAPKPKSGPPPRRPTRPRSPKPMPKRYSGPGTHRCNPDYLELCEELYFVLSDLDGSASGEEN